MAVKPVSVRYSSEGADRVVADAKRIGDGDRDLKRLAAAAQPASAGLRAIDAAARNARSGLEGVASSVPIFGRLAGAMGPVGLAITALSVGYGALGKAGAGAAAQIAAVGDAADRLQVDPELFERLGAALTLSGQKADGLEGALFSLQQKLGEAQEGAKEVRADFDRLRVNAAAPLDTVIRQLADGLAGIEDPAQRVAIANRLMGESGGALVSVLGAGAAGFDQLTAKARDLGILYGGDLIRESQAITAELAAQNEIISTKLNVALAPFARLWLDVKEATAAALGPLGAVLNVLRDIFGLTSDTENRAKLRGQLEGRIADLEGLLETGPTNPFGGDVGPQVLERFEARKSDIRRQLADARAELMMLQEPTSETPTFSTPTFSTPTLGGGGGAAESTPFEDALAKAEERMRALKLEADTFGQARSAVEAYRLEQDLLRAATEQYGTVSENVRELIKVYADDLQAAAAEIEQMTAAQKAQEDQAARTKATMEALSTSVGDWSRQIIDSEKPMRTFVSLLAQFAAQTLTGGGPLGGAVNEALGVTAGGIFSSILGVNKVEPAAAFGRSFTVGGGGAYDSRMVMQPVSPGERVTITPQRSGEALAASRQRTRLAQPSTGRVGFELSRAGTAAEMAAFIGRARRLS